MDEGRSLTDADIKAIVNEFEERFYVNLGRGFWSYVWKAIMLILISIAGYSFLHK